MGLINFLKNIGKPKSGYKRVYGISMKSGFMSSTVMVGGGYPIFKEENRAIEYIKELNKKGIESHTFPFDIPDSDYEMLIKKGILK